MDKTPSAQSSSKKQSIVTGVCAAAGVILSSFCVSWLLAKFGHIINLDKTIEVKTYVQLVIVSLSYIFGIAGAFLPKHNSVFLTLIAFFSLLFIFVFLSSWIFASGSFSGVKALSWANIALVCEILTIASAYVLDTLAAKSPAGDRAQKTPRFSWYLNTVSAIFLTVMIFFILQEKNTKESTLETYKINQARAGLIMMVGSHIAINIANFWTFEQDARGRLLNYLLPYVGLSLSISEYAYYQLFMGSDSDGVKRIFSAFVLLFFVLMTMNITAISSKISKKIMLAVQLVAIASLLAATAYYIKKTPNMNAIKYILVAHIYGEAKAAVK